MTVRHFAQTSHYLVSIVDLICRTYKKVNKNVAPKEVNIHHHNLSETSGDLENLILPSYFKV